MDIIAGLMPTKVYWRPFDRLIEYLLGFAPFLFPVINHVLVLSAHFTLCAVLYLLIRKITHRRLFAAAGTLFFCLNTGIVYTITNTDTINQSWAMLAGAASTFCFFKARLEGKDRLYSGWLGAAALSSLFKEEGIAWFLAPVMMFMVYEYAKDERGIIRKNIAFIVTGVLGTLSYFAVRFMLMGSITLGSETGRNVLSFSPAIIITILKNYCYIFAGAGTCVDTLAFFLRPRNYPVLAVTGIVSVIFWGVIAGEVLRLFRQKRKVFMILVFLLVCAMYVSSPYTVMARGAESQAYEMALMLGLMLGLLLSAVGGARKMMPALCVMLVCMSCVFCHKLCEMHDWTSEIRDFVAEHEADFANKPSKVLVYYVEDIPLEGYSVYRYPMGHGLLEGQALNSLWGWRAKFSVERAGSEAEIGSFPEEYDTVFSLTRSGRLAVFRN